MLFSIIIPTFNCDSTIHRCISSILSQTFTDWEVIIIDGNSSDKTLDIVNSFNSSKLFVSSESDKGIYDAMNKGILKSHGEWLYFLGSDDYLWSNDVLESVSAFTSDKVNVLYGDVCSDTLPNEHMGEWDIDTLRYNRCHQAIFYKKNIFESYGKYDCKYKSCADFDLNLKWFLKEPEKSKHIDLTIAFFSGGGFSSQYKDELFQNDFPWLCITRGWRKMTNSQKVYYARMAKKNKQTKQRHIVSYILWVITRTIEVLQQHSKTKKLIC